MNYLIFIVLIVLVHFGLWKLFVKAGRPGWEALIPFYREYIMTGLSGRASWPVLLLLVPLLNVFVGIGIYLDFVKCFGKRSFWEHVGTVLLPFAVFPLWGSDSTSYWGKSATAEFKEKYPYKKSASREWADAIIFAVIAATLIRAFLIEAYMIPTGSMEKSLLIGDFLFVSKVNYGARIPMTPIAFPFAHHTMPITGGKAYWDGLELDYHRLPGLEAIERNDVVVFNFPMDADAPLSRPVDKRENLIKRCIGIAGDTLRVVGSQVYVNGKAADNAPGTQTTYLVVTNGTDLNPLTLFDMRIEWQRQSDTEYVFTMTKAQSETVSSWSNIAVVKPVVYPESTAEQGIFPGEGDLFPWNRDNYGPVLIPKKGWTVQLDSTTVPLYERAISVYEGNTFEKRSDGYYINGTKADSYTFKMDYYWMMGDNRHNSDDSRYWGFVPEDHIVGKAMFVWLSIDKEGSFFDKIRWNRIFMGIK